MQLESLLKKFSRKKPLLPYFPWPEKNSLTIRKFFHLLLQVLVLKVQTAKTPKNLFYLLYQIDAPNKEVPQKTPKKLFQ